jgi:hypothetical protein
VTLAYVTGRSIDRFVAELLPPLSAEPSADLQDRFVHLNTYSIIKATAKDYLRHAQIQLILGRLVSSWGTRERIGGHLRGILAQWQTLTPIPPGYLAGNILNLLIEIDPNRAIKDLDCSLLPIRSAYLVNAILHRVNFTAATFDRSVFTQISGELLSANHVSEELGADHQQISVREAETIYTLDVDRSPADCPIPIDRPYEQMNITGVTGLPPAQIQTLKLLGAIED